MQQDLSNKQPISEFDLLLIANQLIQDHENYFPGLRATQVEEKEGVLIFKGDYFLDAQGLPSDKTPIVFNMFKYLAHHLSKQFTLEK